MRNELAVAVGAGVGGMLGWGFADFFAKKTIDALGDVVSLVWGHLFGSAALFAVALCHVGLFHQPIGIPSDLQSWALLACFGVLQAAVYLLVYRGFGKGQVALLNPLFASFSGLTAVLSIAAFGERASASRLLALGVIFAGIFLINVDLEALRRRRLRLASIPGLKEIALATVLAAVWTILWDQFVGGRDWLSSALLMYAFMTLALLATAIARKSSLAVSEPRLWKFLILIGVCEAAAYLAISVGYSETTLTSVVALLSGAFSLPTILLARAFLNERPTILQTAGSLVIVGGTMLLPI